MYLYNEEEPNAAVFGSCALGVVGFRPLVKAMWFRGGWFDSLSVLWKEVSTGTFTPNEGLRPGTPAAAASKGRNGGSILVKHSLAPGESVTIPVVIAWYFPNVHYAHGEPAAQAAAQPAPGDCAADCACHAADPAASRPPRWKPYYTTHWKDARDVLLYVRREYAGLRARTQAFHDALFASTLPVAVLDAVSANLAILKSPTVLRQDNGNVWAWEGCFCHQRLLPRLVHACVELCPGHPAPLPALERTLREQELERSMDERGHVNFRSALPDGPTPHTFHAASDGQLGGIMKVYREWQISGDRPGWPRLYPLAKRSMDYCIATWDPDHQGVLVEPHHNTYDIEFWGPDGMCTSFYLGALAAMAPAGARTPGIAEDAPLYRELGQRGAQLPGRAALQRRVLTSRR